MWECNTGIECSECVGGCDQNLEYSDIPEEIKLGNIDYGFDDMTQWEKDNPGDVEYTCEFCGIYTASKPACNKCEGE